MVVILRTTSLTAGESNVQLRAFQAAQVGRSDRSDFTFADDSKMADVHFRVVCHADSCELQSLSGEFATFVNGERVESTLLFDGDRIRAGNTTFVVQSDLPPRPATELAEPVAPVQAVADEAPTLAVLCKQLEFSDELVDVANESEDADEWIERLANQESFLEALQMRAHVMPARTALWWGCSSVDGASLHPKQREAYAAAAAWIDDPSEENRRIAERCADVAGYVGPGGSLALGVFCCQGSIAPADVPEVLAKPGISAKCVGNALFAAALGGRPEKFEDACRSFLARGQSICDGEVELPEALR